MLKITDRVAKIKAILQEHYDWEPTDPGQTATDMMADLLHFLAYYSQNLQRSYDRAIGHFEAEREEEDLPEYDYYNTDPDNGD